MQKSGRDILSSANTIFTLESIGWCDWPVTYQNILRSIRNIW